METITSVGSCIAILTTIATLFLNIHIIHEHKRKKFRAELENFEEYFEKYYDPNNSKNLPLLIQDKAAQNLTRMKFFNKELLTYFIQLHEQKKISLDHVLDHLYFAYNLIEIKNENDVYLFKSAIKMPQLRKYLNYAGYVIFIIFAIVLHTPTVETLFNWWLNILFTIALVFASLISLNQADNIEESLKFLNLIKALDDINKNNTSENDLVRQSELI
ncbi:hypothetical protein G9F32_06405 [Acinetobacter sp. 194]|uniref:hypothetical protein n=1 Tax=Acinetobacter shaoyimingii TaxID=2715164 RepID=UPI0014089A33|nr:hypothetical protein [Acinetobacter shaoyimingii]NHB57665.1 hypothetical protein [Acinetobacter shaoyimingii]